MADIAPAAITFLAAFDLGQRVIVDDRDDVVATVIGVVFYANRTMYLLAWFADRLHNEEWVDGFRIKEWKQPGESK